MTLATSLFSGVKLITRGAITISNPDTSDTATISAVDTTKTRCAFNGGDNNDCKVALTNSTTVTASRSDNTANSVVGYEIIEYY